VISTHKHKKTTITTLTIFGIVTVFLLIASSIIVIIPPAFALTRYFNCTTQIANKTGKLTFDDVNRCYDAKFPTKSNDSSNNNNNNNNGSSDGNGDTIATTTTLGQSHDMSFSDDYLTKTNNQPTGGIILPITNP
jgi:hypothetical protein